MINAEELRLGNWVLIEGTNKFDRVQRLSHGLINGWKSDKYSHIALSPDILEKAGFEQAENYQDGVLTNNGIRVMYHNGEWQFNDLTRNKKLTSLHQLQNLYYILTGKELQITL